jgi:UDP-2,3-diacylglucosamine pyrophosphatase LpxH
VHRHLWIGWVCCHLIQGAGVGCRASGVGPDTRHLAPDARRRLPAARTLPIATADPEQSTRPFSELPALSDDPDPSVTRGPFGLMYHDRVQRLVIADSHLGQRTGDVEEMEALLERAVAAGIQEVIYLGDAFLYLLGMSKLWTAAVRELLQVWKRCRERGVRVVLVEGNRDFFLDEPDLAPYLDWSGRVYQLSAGTTTYRLVHGDLVNQRDLQYRFWSTVSKSFISRFCAQLLPQRMAMAIVRNMEARLATTNLRFRFRKPVKALRRQAHQAWAEGVDVLLWGHFHTPWEHRQDERLAMVVPAWLASRSSLLIAADGSHSLVDLSLTPLAAPPTIEQDELTG